jgi:hypothetical protein
MNKIYNRQQSMNIDLEKYKSYFGSLQKSREKCFNIGAGAWNHEAWTNIDLAPQSEEFEKIQAPCIAHNIVENPELPIPHNTASLIYTSHVIEHLPEETVQELLVSVYKSLDKDGVLRIVTGPDSDTDWQAINRNDTDWWYFYDDFFNQCKVKKGENITIYDKWLYHICTPRSFYSKTPCNTKYRGEEIGVLINRYKDKPSILWDMLAKGINFNIDNPGEHISWWNGDKLLDFLNKAGFRKVRISAYGQSSSVFMRDLNDFDETYPYISLYVEAIK